MHNQTTSFRKNRVMGEMRTNGGNEKKNTREISFSTLRESFIIQETREIHVLENPRRVGHGRVQGAWPFLPENHRG